MTKFVVNAYYFALTKMIFIIITKEFIFYINFDVINLSTNILQKRILKHKTINILNEIKDIRKFVTENRINT